VRLGRPESRLRLSQWSKSSRGDGGSSSHCKARPWTSTDLAPQPHGMSCNSDRLRPPRKSLGGWIPGLVHLGFLKCGLKRPNLARGRAQELVDDAIVEVAQRLSTRQSIADKANQFRTPNELAVIGGVGGDSMSVRSNTFTCSTARRLL
jgi:hypothetical protein